MSEFDRLFAQPRQRVADFIFNEDVVRVFPDIVKRSVPNYPTTVENTGVPSAQFIQPNSALYNLGRSLGVIAQSLRRYVRNDGCRVIGVDSSHAMIERCGEYPHTQDAMYQELLSVKLIEADILALDLQPTPLVAMNFTLQFVAPDQRLSLLRRIRQALLLGGTLILSGKLRFADTREHAPFTDLHITLRRANGYSELEIAQKHSTLGNVMLPDTFEEHREQLLAAGFSRVSRWLQCLNFTSMITLL